MKAAVAMLAWCPQSGRIAVGRHPDTSGWSRGYPMTGGAAYADWQHAKPAQRLIMLFIAFHTIVVRDGVHPQQAHAAFLAIDEFRAAIAPDTPGAEV